MIRKFNTRLLFTETDSLCYELHEKNPYKKMHKYKELFDLRNFSVNTKYCCSDNKKEAGKMKDEYGGKSILKFVCLKSNLHSILDESNKEKSTNKGHNAFIEFKNFTISYFKKRFLHRLRGIKSNIHNLGTSETNHVLMINDIFSKMELIPRHMDI